MSSEVAVDKVHEVYSEDDEVEDKDEIEDAEQAKEIIDPLEDYPSEIDEIELNHSRILSLTELKLDRFNKLERLYLRQNLITSIEGLAGQTQSLTELELYDNRITEIQNLSHLTSLVYLDLSFNKIKRIENLETLIDLTELYLVANKISKIENLETLVKVENLELGANRIRTIENLDALINLEKLWLGKNKITKFQNLNLPNLKIISIQSNRITSLLGLEDVPNLEELYISHNGLTKIEGLDNLTNLKVLDIANNKIEKLENIEHLVSLQEFWGNHNLFDSFADLEQCFKTLTEIETVYLEGNPLQTKDRTAYRRKVKLALPDSLTQIDATLCKMPISNSK